MASDSSSTGSISINPYITCADAASAIEFYKQAFGATETFERWLGPKGNVCHAELRFGSSTLFVSDTEHGADLPAEQGNATVQLFLNVTDLKRTVEKARKFGGEVLQDINELHPHGSKDATVKDPAGHVWTVCQQFTNASKEEMAAARAKFQQSGCF